jgi:dienelactone hydrolase
VNRLVGFVVGMMVLGGLAAAQAPLPLPVGVVIPKVACAANPKQTYALYLPSNYSASRKWPIIYVFDPGAQGQSAAETVRAAAEKFGYIVAASNNSSNGPMSGSAEAADALWQDTQQRFPVDERRRYLAGMSGGARVATRLALSCQDCPAGVIANAAGFPIGAEPTRSMKFAYFAGVGNADFNYAEFVELRPKLDDAGARYRIRVFEGQHGWAPPEVWLEALNWMDIQAMAAGSLPRDQSRIQQSLAEAMATARKFEEKNDWLSAVREYQFVVRDFNGLADVTAAQARVSELSKDKRVKAGEKDEASAIAQQARLTSVPSAQLEAVASGNLDASALMELRRDISDLKKQATDAGKANDPRTLIVRRALGDLIVQAYESGQRSLEKKNYRVALLYFDLAAAGSVHSGWAHYQRAIVYALMSDKDGTFAELRLASAAGFHDVSALEAPEFQAFRGLPQFQALSAEWKLAGAKD